MRWIFILTVVCHGLCAATRQTTGDPLRDLRQNQAQSQNVWWSLVPKPKSGLCTQKKFPFIMPAQVKAQPEAYGGVWYRYRSLGINKLPASNIYFNVTIVGPTTIPLTSEPAQAYWANAAYSENGKCQSDYYLSVYSNNGTMAGYGFSAGDAGVIHPESYTVVYTDNKNVMIEYGCLKKSKDVVASTCDQPLLHVDTRLSPDRLDSAKQADMDKLIDRMLAPHCIKAKDIPKVTVTKDPFCPFAPAPECTARMIRGLREMVARPNAKKGNVTTRSQCKWPLVIPHLEDQRHEPKKVTGTWYMYRKLYTDEPDTVNEQYHVNNIGPGELPMSTVSAQWQWIQYAQYNGEKDKTCHNGFWSGAVGENGAQIGFDVRTTGEPMPIWNSMNALHYDDKFALDYGCIVANTQTKVCDKPFVYASTRIHPTHLPQADKDKFDRIIDGFLRQYGCSVQDVPVVKWIASKPACKYADASDCIAKAIKGLSQAVDLTAINTLPDNYVSFSAADKQAWIWKNILTSRYLPNATLPTEDFDPEVTLPLLLSPVYTGKAFSIQSDEYPADRNKILNHFGVVAKVLFSVLPNSTYTGVFKGGSENVGLIRLSWLNLDVRNIVPGLAMKIFISGRPSVNIFAQGMVSGLGGQKSNHNFFAETFSNYIPIPPNMDELSNKLISTARAAIKLQPGGACNQPLDNNKSPLVAQASVEQSGRNVSRPVAPLIVSLVPNPANAQPANDTTDFRVNLAKIPAGGLLYTVYARPSENATDRLIGRIQLITQFVASDYGDNKLLFQHPTKRC
ncbi:uncharacterized protein LOC129593152 [Paramacrobiotus metropolitanus]|uniref:uncharacterized protein LOC129593152 n=1 Tax=Paramacrobiotus metropolitanus TaxID=2943436 RepID=UPI002445D414|nr:uncharacterized protein LOC129593152 [Paramacrobiotus metropolitanus]